MHKRFTSLLLSVFLCLSMAIVYAEERVTVKDNFNSAVVAVQGTAATGLANSYRSEVMEITRDAATRQLYGTTASITEEGYEGKALLIAPVSETSFGVTVTQKNRLCGKVFVIDDKLNAADISYRFCIRSRGEGDDETPRMFCGFSTTDLFDYEVGITVYKDKLVLAGLEESSFVYELNTWYKVKYVITANKAEIYLSTAEGTELTTSEVNGSYKNASVGFSNPESATEGFAMAVDDAEVVQYRTADIPSLFEDLSPLHWSYDAVEVLYNNQVVDGKTNTLFMPDDIISREEFVKLVIGAAGYELEEGATTFADVSADSWYAPYVAVAVENGIASGVNESEFGVGLPLTREDAMVMLDRTLAQKNMSAEPVGEESFADSAELADYAKEATLRVAGTGLIQGDEKNCINPKGNLTRAEACVIIDRLNKLLAPEKISDRIDQAMPKKFNPVNLERELLCKVDFENGGLPAGVTSNTFNPSKLDRTGGYESKVSYKVDSGDSVRSLDISISGLNIEANSAILCIAKMRCEDISGTYQQNKQDSYAEGLRTTMSITGSNQYKYNYDIYETINGTMDWTDSMQYMECPFDVNKVSFSCYIFETVNQGVGWFDELCIYKVAFDPFLEAILETPNYKGIIYGENGEGDINLATSVKTYGNVYKLEDCQVKAQVVDKNDQVILQSTLDNIDPELRISFSSKYLSMNEDYYLQLIMSDKETGKQHGFREWTLRKRPADFKLNNYFNEHGQFVIDGEPTFLMGVYGMNKVYDTIQAIEDSPIQMVLPYGWVWFKVSNDGQDNISVSADQALMDYAQEKGVKLMPSIKVFNYDTATSTGYFKSVFTNPEVQRDVYEGLSDAMDHPAVLGYYLADEQSAARYGAFCEWQTKVFSEKDLNDFTFNTFTYVLPERTQVRFADTTNCSCYPIQKGDGSDDVSRITKYLSPVTKTVPAGNRPFYGVMQVHDAGVNSGTDVKRGPNAAEWRSMAWQGVSIGLQGILWYGFFNMMQEDGEFQNKPFSETWPVFRGVLEEVEEFYPVILSTEPAPYVEVQGGDWLNVLPKRHDGKSYLITTNITRNLQTAKFRLEGAKKIKGLYSGKTFEKDKEGWFTAEYEPIGVEIFEIEQDDFLSHEAQLSSMGFFDDTISYFLTDPNGDQYSNTWDVTVPENLQELSYAAKISDKAKLYINGKKVPASGTISINGVNTLQVKVEAEDSRFTTEFTYQILKGGANE